MNIDSLREQYMPIFDQIRRLPEFEEFVENSNIDTFNDLSRAIRKADILDGYGDTGETKGVFVPYDEDIVFKFPLLSRCKGFDYCRAEVRNYRAAEKAEVDQYFAWTDKLFDVYTDNGYYPIYVMVKVDCDEEAITDMMVETFCENNRNPDDEDVDEVDEDARQDYEDRYNSACSGSTEGVDEWFHSTLDCREYAKLDQFLCFNDIDDIHSGNLGFYGDSVVIIDYSGYNFVLEHTDKEWYAAYGL